MSDEMAELLSRSTTDRAEDNQARVTRDKAYTLLKQAIDEIRSVGQYVFWRDAQRYKGYVSAYFKRHNSGNKTNQDNTPGTE